MKQVKIFLRKWLNALNEEDVRKIIWDIELKRLRRERQDSFEEFLKGENK